MNRKLAIKRLTASDLTFFEWHFRNRNAGNQKAVNLNADVFIRELFPSLPESSSGRGGRIPVDLYIYGPGLAGELNLQRKIIKFSTYKNWRLDGEFIHNPSEEPERFNVLEPGDMAVLDFGGDVTPTKTGAFFIARNTPDDAGLHEALDLALGRRSMMRINHLQVDRIITAAAPAAAHPIRELLIEAELADAAHGGTQGVRALHPLLGGRRVSRLSLLEAKRRADEIGQLGEELVEAHLQTRTDNHEIDTFERVSNENAVSPYDFCLRERGADRILVDVKTTTGPFERLIHVSTAELEAMRDAPERYDIYRVYEVSEEGASLRIAQGLREFARSILAVLETLPPGVEGEGVTIDPARLDFGPELQIHAPDGLEEDEE